MPPEVISVSRRTDIPAFFTPWWLRRVRAGHVLVRNPRNPKHIIDVSLEPEDVLAVVYWSRDYGRLLPHLPELDDRGLRPCFHFTLTGYGQPLEQRSPAPAHAFGQFEALAHRYGPSRIVWRYDPIVVGSRHSTTFHEENFGRLAEKLAPLVRHCIISFLDPYPSTRRELARIELSGEEHFDPPSWTELRNLTSSLVRLAAHRGLAVRACCEPDVADLVQPARCIDGDWVREFTSADASAFRYSATRQGCGCVFARDIGAYHTCAHGCIYCYANESPETATANARAVHPDANNLGASDIEPTSLPKKKSYESGQLTLDNVVASRKPTNQ